MNWDAIGAVAESIAAVAVIFSLIYLALQLRQSNELEKRAAGRYILQGRIELNNFLGKDVETSEHFWMGLQEPHKLSPGEWSRWLNVGSSLIRHMEVIYLEQLNGTLPQDIWESQVHVIDRFMAMPGVEKWCDEIGDGLHPEFRAHLKKLHEKGA